ncbi:hypothetical protein DFQ28_011605 [Apophysomyces sp. BC1034]|nr:hypothetical protein DFQ28_011605 [Apophysomyces sp. BC1034]
MYALGRLKRGERNKTEAAYEDFLRALQVTGEVLWFRFEGMKLRLADNTSYTPDFAVMRADGLLECHEVKGFWRDDARVKIKVAAEMFPIRFVAVRPRTKREGGGWQQETFDHPRYGAGGYEAGPALHRARSRAPYGCVGVHRALPARERPRGHAARHLHVQARPPVRAGRQLRRCAPRRHANPSGLHEPPDRLFAQAEQPPRAGNDNARRTMSEIEFKSAFDAVRFALCYSSQQYGETPMAKRLSGESVGTGMGLVGLDGAGQAGLIRRELWELPELHLSVVVARAAPRDLPCSCGSTCCSGRSPNIEWQAAIGWLTQASAAYCSGFSHYRVRRAIIERMFGVKCDFVDIAHECDAHVNTVSKQNAAVRRWIDGSRKNDKDPGVERVAWSALERRFNEMGLLKKELE